MQVTKIKRGYWHVEIGPQQRYVSVKERTLGRFGKDGVSFGLSCSAAVIKGVMGASIEAEKLRA